MIMGYNNPSEAVFSATGAGVSGSEIGRVEFDSMSFYRGTVVFDLAEGDGDFIKINGAMTKVSGASPLVLEMNVSAYDLQAWLEASESDEWSANLMSFATDGSNVSADDFTLKLQDGIMGKITVSELDGVSTLTANLSLVPEPAKVAAILGAFALLLVARRRRAQAKENNFVFFDSPAADSKRTCACICAWDNDMENGVCDGGEVEWKYFVKVLTFIIIVFE